MTDPVPAEKPTTDEELGPEQHQYVPRVASYITLLAWAIMAIAGGVLFAFLSFNLLVTLFPGQTDFSADRTTTLVLGGFFALCAIGGLLIGAGFLVPLIRPKTSVIEYVNGLAIYRNRRRAALVPWDHIAHVTQSITQYRVNFSRAGTVYRYTIQTTDQKRFIFTNTIRDVERLGERIQKATFPPIMARALASLSDGKPVEFGSLRISQEGVTIGDMTERWSNIRDVRMSAGRIQFITPQRSVIWENLAIEHIPDARVVLALANQLRVQHA